jgi:hypothetical protein
MKKTLRIGSNRGKARIWIEGQSLASKGWKVGDSFVSYFRAGALVYEKVMAGVSGSRKVAGTADRPIIDTNTDKILASLGQGTTHATVDIAEGNIWITPGKAPASGIVSAVVALALVAASIGAPYLSQFKRGAQRVLVACEESATVRDEFARRGHDAVSCDMLDTRNPYGWHITGDVTPYLDQDWDIVIGFPPCTYLTVSAAYAFKDPDFDRYPGVGYHQKLHPDTLRGEARRQARDEAIAFVDLIYSKSRRVAVENPKGFLSSMWMKPTQIIQPYWFGDPESKETCLWLKGLDPLQPTNILDVKDHGYLVEKGEHAGKWRWPNQAPCGASKMAPHANRAKDKSVTYKGIAIAMADAWGGALV